MRVCDCMKAVPAAEGRGNSYPSTRRGKENAGAALPARGGGVRLALLRNSFAEAEHGRADNEPGQAQQEADRADNRPRNHSSIHEQTIDQSGRGIKWLTRWLWRRPSR